MSRQIYKYCKVQKKVLPIEQCYENEEYARSNIQLVNSEIPPTKHPLNNKHYTCSKQFERETKARGYETVGNEYRNGYDPEPQARKERLKEVSRKFRENFIRNYDKFN